MKKIKFITFNTFFCILLLFACTEDEKVNNNEDLYVNKSNEFFLEMKNRFNEVGIVNLIDNYKLLENEVIILESIIGTIPNNNIATFKTVYYDGSMLYIFKLPQTQKYLTVKISNNQLQRLFIAEIDNSENEYKFLITTKNNKLIESFTISNNKLIFAANKRERNVYAYAGDCNELGPRKKGETYDECFHRNWTNFCCDFVGCIAQITNPIKIAAVISVLCTC